MGKVLTARSMLQAQDLLERAEDGDTICLAWAGASKHSAQAVESRAMGLGLDVVVEVGPSTNAAHTNLRRI